MTRAVIALGANLGGRLGTLDTALRRIAEQPGTTVTAVSQAYETQAWPSPDHPAYANAVALVETSLSADDLLRALQSIESDLGRDRGGSLRYGPRPIDLDIITFGDEVRADASLILPHPRAAEREFVVVPWLEVDADARWPGGSPVDRSRAVNGRVTGTLGPLGRD